MRTRFSFWIKSVPVIVLIVSAVVSCKKKSDEQSCPRTMTSVSGTYKLSALTYKESSGAPDQDFMIFYDDCEKDDLIDLLPGGTWNYRDIGNVCSPDASDWGTWSFNGNNIISDGLVNGVIERFDCRTMVLYVEDVYIPKDRLTLTIVKQ